MVTCYQVGNDTSCSAPQTTPSGSANYTETDGTSCYHYYNNNNRKHACTCYNHNIIIYINIIIIVIFN